MNFNLADLSRRLENIVRYGVIAEVKHGRVPLARVKFGDIITALIPMAAPRAGAAKTLWPLTVGEQCIIFSKSGDLAAGVVFPGVASNLNHTPDDNPDNHCIQCPDSATVDYNQVTITTSLPWLLMASSVLLWAILPLN